MADKKVETPMLDELLTGPWPSFVKELKQLEARKPMVADLLGQLEMSYQEGQGHWKHGGLVGVQGYGGGVIGRYSDSPDKFPNVAHFHTIRVNQPSGWFYTSDALRTICDIWEQHGSGVTNMHGSTGDMVLLGTVTDELEPTFQALTHQGWDLGGSGSAVRTPSCCCGKARCEWACYDTMNVTYDMTQEFQDELHRPAFPYKFKMKFSGCSNDCVAAIARADLSVIGTWRDAMRIDQKEVAAYAAAGLNIARDVVARCPTKCCEFDGKSFKVDNENCVRCMHCINVMPKALRPGTDTGATILVGSKAPIMEGALLSSVIIPFMKVEPPYTELKELVRKIQEWWDENGKNRERIGELIQRMGMSRFLEAIGVELSPEQVFAPRANPYIFYDEFFEAADDEGQADA